MIWKGPRESKIGNHSRFSSLIFRTLHTRHIFIFNTPVVGFEFSVQVTKFIIDGKPDLALVILVERGLRKIGGLGIAPIIVEFGERIVNVRDSAVPTPYPADFKRSITFGQHGFDLLCSLGIKQENCGKSYWQVACRINDSSLDTVVWRGVLRQNLKRRQQKYEWPCFFHA